MPRSTVFLPWIASVLGIETVAQRIASPQHEATGARSLWEEVSWARFDEPDPEPEGPSERKTRPPEPVDGDWGRSESLDPDNVGDIADEGAGHRG